MGKGRNCGSDIFAINSQVDIEKVSVLYTPGITECAPNDPFNDWTITLEQLVSVIIDIIDHISGEIFDIQFSDELGEYSGNTITDYWENDVNYLLDLVDTLGTTFDLQISDVLSEEYVAIFNDILYNVDETYSDSTIVKLYDKMFNSQSYTGGNEYVENVNDYSLGIGFETSVYGNYSEDQMNTITFLNSSTFDMVNLCVNYTVDGNLSVNYTNVSGDISQVFLTSSGMSSVKIRAAIGTSSFQCNVYDTSNNLLGNISDTFSNLVCTTLRISPEGNGNSINRYFTTPIIFDSVLESDINNFITLNDVGTRHYW
jgi:hypothetical protein